MSSLRDIALRIYDIGAVQFGSFTLKSGQISPYYLDLRLAISYPELLEQLSTLIWEKMRLCHFDILCGAPYAAVPLATAVSLFHAVPMVLPRKEKKEYGTKKNVEGVFKKGQRCLIIEDVITSGQSVIETSHVLQNEGLLALDVAAVIDRQQGGRANLQTNSLALHSVFTIEQLLVFLLQEKRIDEETQNRVLAFIKGST